MYFFHKIYSSFEENFKIFKYTKNHPKIYKIAQNIDMWDKWRDSWLLETWKRYLHSNHNTQPKYGVHIDPRPRKFHSIETSFARLNFSLLLRWHFIMTQSTGVIRMNTTFLEGRLGLTLKRLSYRPTGTLPSPRSVLVWKSAKRSSSLSSTNGPSLCTYWSLAANSMPHHWVVTNGRY